MKIKLRTDGNIIQIPAVAWGPAGFSFFDADYGTTVYRLTDEDTLGGASFDMGDDGGACRWAKDSSRLWVSTTGGKQLLFDFANGVLGKLEIQSTGVSIHFSRKRADRYFDLAYNGILVDDVSGQLKTFADFSPFPSNWHSSFAVSADETTCTMAFGAGNQGSANLVVSYRVGKGFRILDTLTGIVTGDWGKLGKISTPVGWHLHEASQLMDSRYATFGATASDIPKGQPVPRYVWDIASLDVYPRMPGHQAEGKGMFALLGANWQLKTQKFGAEMVVGGPLLDPHTPSHDAHYSWNNDRNDKQPFVVSGCPVGGKVAGALTVPGEAEIVLVDPKTGVVSRLCHTFSSGASQYFACANAIANVSQDGEWVVWPSDLMGATGGRSDLLAMKIQL